jgi:hypothetical protein
MQSELSEISNPQESIRWLTGGIMSLGKAWWDQIVYGGNPKEAAKVKTPGIATVALLVLALVSCMLPGMRQGMIAVFDTWNLYHSSFGPAQLEKMGREAEQSHDATTLALVAMRLPMDSREKDHWADLAVSWDPSLTWIYFQMESPTVLVEDVHPISSERIAQLQSWDPANAVPYLMEGEQAFRDFERNLPSPSSWNPSVYGKEDIELAKDQKWVAAMDKAFQAAHFNDYHDARFDLNLAVQRKLAMNRPIDLALSAAGSRVPNLLNVRAYSKLLIHRGMQREAAGDNSGAAEDYWRVAHFGQRMQLESQPDGIERLIAIAIIQNSFEKLKNLFDKNGRADEARYAAFELDNVRAAGVGIRDDNRRVSQASRLAAWSALMIHFSGALILVTALFSCLSVLWLALRFGDATGSLLASRRRACAIGRIAPVLLVFSIVLFYTNYFPYLRSFNDASPQNAQSLTRTFYGLLQVPFSISQAWTYGRGAVYFWTGALVVGCLSVLILVIRMPARGKMEKIVA